MPGPGFWKHGGFGRAGFVCQPRMIDCPERKEQVHFIDCLECGKFRVWHAKDDDMKRCWYEYKDLKSRGYYDGTWDDHPENFDPETFAEIQERKRLNAEVNRELESEFAEFRSKAAELEEDPSYYYGEYWTYREEEGEQDSEEEDEDQDEDEEEDF